MKDTIQNERYKYIDYLKSFAIIAVIIIHVLGDRYFYTFSQEGSWYVLLFFASLVRFAVPVFIMCSGALMLNESKNITIKKTLYNAVKYVVIFILWSFIYALTDYLLVENNNYNFFCFIKEKMINYKYHLWYLPVLIYCYIMTPVLRCALKKENKKIIEYLLIIFFIVIIVNSFFENVQKNILPVELLSYIMIYITGWYLSTFNFSNKFNRIVIIIGLISYVLSPVANIFLSFIFDTKVFWTSNNFNILNYLSSVGVFVFLKTNESKLHQSKLVTSLSSKTLYVYLIHVLIIEVLQQYCIKEHILVTGWGLLIFPVLILAVLIISYIASCIWWHLFRKKRKNKNLKHEEYVNKGGPSF